MPPFDYQKPAWVNVEEGATPPADAPVMDAAALNGIGDAIDSLETRVGVTETHPADAEAHPVFAAALDDLDARTTALEEGGGSPTLPSALEPLEVLTNALFYTEGTSFNLVTDAGTPAGAVLLLVQAEDYATLADMPTPTGTAGSWTLIDSADRGSNLTHMKIFTRTVGSAGAQTVTVHQNAADPGEFYGALYVFPPDTVVEAVEAVTGSSGSTHSTPPVTATGADQLVISAWVNEYTGGSPRSYGTPPGIERSRATTTGSGATLLTATTVTTGAGATDAQDVAMTGTAGPYIAATVALSGAAGEQSLADYIDGQLAAAVALEELQDSRAVGAVSATTTALLTVANTTMRVAALSLAATGAITASDSNYWSVALTRYRAGSATTIATRTTQVTAPNGGVAANTAWTLDLVAFGSAQYLQKGDVLAVTFTATGSPTAWAGAVASWRYEPGVG